MSATTPNAPAVTLDDLMALNDEISALVRSGVPLERGLCELGQDMPGPAGRLAAAVAERTTRGESLAAVLADPACRLPTVYRAVVVAGLRSGRLPAALESLAGSVRRLAETRRSVAMASLYPLLIVLLVWGFFAFFAAQIAPALLKTFQALDVPGAIVFRPLAWLGESAGYWGPLGPVIIILLAAVWWRLATRASVANPGRAAWLLGWIPWLGRTLRWSRAATLVEILALLLENGVPLHEAVLLAAEASGDPGLLSVARQWAACIQRGETFQPADRASRRVLPPMLLWLMGGRRQDLLLPALRSTAEMYHRRARHQADLARIFLPVVLTLGVAGVVTVMYVLTLFLPYTTLLKSLAR
jgi:type II secretory pathway component PulF